MVTIAAICCFWWGAILMLAGAVWPVTVLFLASIASITVAYTF